jgi:hypothetical protein
MSNTPIFDAVLAESDPDIWLASTTVFPHPAVFAAGGYIGPASAVPAIWAANAA